ncbi:MAG TPA: penicillin-binding transpeptidase domain-containing protein [Opitutaceae bacterium]|jgi:penicillin-binding protein 2
MPVPDAERPATAPNRRLVEAREAIDYRIRVFHFIVAGLLVILAGGLAYRQLIQTGYYDQSERQQTQRRILLPGPRGNIYDRNHRLLVGNRPRFSAVVYLDGLQDEFRKEAMSIRSNYRASGESDVTWGQVEEIARYTVVQRYFDQANLILHRNQTLDPKELKMHFQQQLLVPFPLFDDLTGDEFARLLESLPVRSPIQLAVNNVRTYPYGSAASHVLGYVVSVDNVNAGDFPGADLQTLRLKGTEGADGLEKVFDARLQGHPGGVIYRVDPSGYKVNPPLQQRMPRPGEDLVTSLDINVQLAAEHALDQFSADNQMPNLAAAAVAIDVRTGEVLALASKPDYDLNKFPRDPAAVADVQARHAWTDTAVAARYHPGSTFKLLVSIAGLRSGRLDPADESVDCDGRTRIGNRWFGCDNGDGRHGRQELPEAIADSCDIYFYLHGLAIGPEIITDEARRMHLDGKTGIELPGEVRARVANVPKLKGENAWHDGDTAEISIGQGPIDETPIAMACFVASVARGETYTKPTLLHDPNRPDQHTEAIGLSDQQLGLIRKGMEEVISYKGETNHGTADLLQLPVYRIPGITLAGKTGTATLEDRTDAAWFVCYAPADHPRVAVVVQVKGDKPGENFQGGVMAAPLAIPILRAYFAKPGEPVPGVTESTQVAASFP